MNVIAEKIRLIESLSTSQNATVHLLDKVVYYLAAEERRKLAQLRTKLRDFEIKYALTTAEFQQRFGSGELGDDMDFFEWDGVADMVTRLVQKLDGLREAKSVC